MRETLPIPDNPEAVTHGFLHAASISALAATIMGWLPIIAAVIPVLYYCILIWESSTVQHYVRNVRMRRKAKRLLKLKVRAKVAQAKLDAEEVLRAARQQAREHIKHTTLEAKKEATAEAVKLEAKVPPV